MNATVCSMHSLKTIYYHYVSSYIIIMQVIFYFLWDHWAHPGFFENRIPLKPALGCGNGCGRAGGSWGGGGSLVWSLANYSVAYEETQSNRVSDFRDFLCSLFPKAILSDFHFPTKTTGVSNIPWTLYFSHPVCLFCNRHRKKSDTLDIEQRQGGSLKIKITTLTTFGQVLFST